MDTTISVISTIPRENIMEIMAIIISPVVAVLITVWLQRRHQIYDAQKNVFFTLMANRKSFPIEKDWVRALNLIDVVFAKQKEITQLWHRYYDLLAEKPRKTEAEAHVYLELLSTIAIHLGYDNLHQTDIDKFYTPQAYADRSATDSDFEREFLRVLKNTAKFVVEPLPNAPIVKDERNIQSTQP
jgi:hypothetical protein